MDACLPTTPPSYCALGGAELLPSLAALTRAAADSCARRGLTPSTCAGQMPHAGPPDTEAPPVLMRRIRSQRPPHVDPHQGTV